MLRSGLAHRTRIAAWLTRAAFEDAVRCRLDVLGLPVGEATMRSALTCLTVADPAVAVRADHVWSRLSAACHQHAYELAPTGAEVLDLVASVRDLLPPPPPPEAPAATGGGRT